jgi:phosphopantetheinyl transferase
VCKIGGILIEKLIEVQFNKISDLKNVSVLLFKDFSYLEQAIDLRQFNRMRRVFRDDLIKEWLGSKGYLIDYNRMKINIEGKEFNFSGSYSEYKIVFIKSVGKVGIDIEMYKRISPDNIHLFASEGELNSLSSEFKPLSISEKSTLIWCIKESVGKLFDIGLSKGFDAFKLKKKDKIYLSTFLNLSCEHSINIFYKILNDYCIVVAKLQTSEMNN